MKIPPRPNAISEDAAYTELQSVQPAADRIRFAALRLTGALSIARKKSLLRQEKAAVARHGPASPAAMGVRRRLALEERFAIAVRAEQQRGAVEPVQRSPEALILRGRVVDTQRLGLRGLTVSAVNSQGQPTASTVSSETGYFEFLIPAKTPASPENVFLLVNDSARNILYRGCEGFAVKGGAVITRELMLGGAEPVPQPTPPPAVDPKRVTVPDVRGLRQRDAELQLTALCLKPANVTKPAFADQTGRILDQNPDPGASVPLASTVTLTVGVATTSVEVPNLVERRLAEAEKLLKEMRLRRGKVTPADATDASLVIRQKPVAGTQVAEGTAVDLETASRSGGRTRPATPKKVAATKRASSKKTTLKTAARTGDEGARP